MKHRGVVFSGALLVCSIALALGARAPSSHLGDSAQSYEANRLALLIQHHF